MTTEGTGQLQATERIVHIARIRDGNEADVRRMVQDRFPHVELEGMGISGVTVFIGSTYMVTEWLYTGEYTPTFSALRNNGTVTAFLEEIGRMLDDQPAPLPDAPAMQFLASQAFHWRAGQAPEGTPRVRPKEASSDRV